MTITHDSWQLTDERTVFGGGKFVTYISQSTQPNCGDVPLIPQILH